VAVSPDGSKVYVTNFNSDDVSVIATASNTVISSPIAVGSSPIGVAVTPDGSKVYVANEASNNVSVIATAGNTVIGAPIAVSSGPTGVAVTSDGSKVYVANDPSNNVSVIATATNTVTATIPVCCSPAAFGVFIQPTLAFSSLSAVLFATGARHPAFALDASFGLGAGSNGINPPSEPVMLQVGPYTALIPAGSFRQLAAGQKFAVYAFSGAISNVWLALDILSFGHNSYQFGAAGTPVDLSAVPNPVPVSFSIGNNVGSTTVNAERRIPWAAATRGAQ